MLGYRAFDFPACRFGFCVVSGQPTLQITNRVIPFHLREQLVDVLGVHNQGITVQHGTHVADQTPGSICANAEQFSDLPLIDDFGGYFGQRGSYQRYTLRPIR